MDNTQANAILLIVEQITGVESKVSFISNTTQTIRAAANILQISETDYPLFARNPDDGMDMLGKIRQTCNELKAMI